MPGYKSAFAGHPMCAHVEAHKLGGCGKPPNLRHGPAGRGRAGAPERGGSTRAVILP
jgi:hypothetical protein